MISFATLVRTARWLPLLLVLAVPEVQAADPFRLGLQMRTAHLPWWLAAEEGLFEKYDLQVDLVLLPADVDLFTRFDTETLDAVAATSLDLLNGVELGLEQRGVMLLGESDSGDAILGSERITAVRDLRRARVAYWPGAEGELLLSHALRGRGLSVESIESVPRVPDEALAALLAGEVDAAVGHSPELVSVLAESDLKPVYDASEEPGLVVDLLTANEGRANRDKETYKALIRVWDEAVSNLRRFPQRAHAALADAVSLDETTLEQSFQGVRLFNLAENMQELRGRYQKGFATMSESAYEMLGNQYDRPPNANSLLVLSPIRQVAARR